MLASDNADTNATAAFQAHEFRSCQLGMLAQEGVQRYVDRQAAQINCNGAKQNRKLRLMQTARDKPLR